MQLNIWGGKLIYKLTDFIAAEQPDILCMQEVNDMSGPGGSHFATLDEIKQAGGFTHSFMAPTYSYRFMERQCNYGIAILSKVPLSQQDMTFTHGAHKENFDFTHDDSNIRSLQHCTIEINSKTVHLLNYHGILVAGSKMGNTETLAHNQKIASLIDSLDGPIIVTGDFNLQPDSPSMQLLTSRLTDLSSKHGLTNTYLPQFSHHNVVCDYILVNEAIKVSNFSALEEPISDHKALAMEFEV